MTNEPEARGDADVAAADASDRETPDRDTSDRDTSDRDAPASPPNAPRAICVIGASAGGLDALQQFFDAVPVPNDVAWVVVQHLSPEHRSLMPELLARHTAMPVAHAVDGEWLAPGTVYLNAPKLQLRIKGGRLDVQPVVTTTGRLYLPIDIAFESAAQSVGDRAIGVILSGTGSDGTRGARELKAAGGALYAQSPEEAQFDGMPRSIIATGLADRVLTAAELPDAVLTLVQRGVPALGQDRPDGTPTADMTIARLLGLVRDRVGTDFTGYKPSTIVRRIERRVAMHAGLDLEDYLRLCRDSDVELQQLHRDLLINVTRFMRDEEAFRVLADTVVPALLADTPSDRELRLWVPACSTGEEPYSLVMLLLEELERRGEHRAIRVFATDVDADAVEFASAGRYPESIAADISLERLGRFFFRDGDGYRVTRAVRDRVIFARHDLLRDPPLTRMDFVSCRNMMIYLGAETQRRALALLAYALRQGGFLFLGASESVGTMAELFDTIDPKWKVYRARHGGRQTPIEMLPSRLRRGDVGPREPLLAFEPAPSQRERGLAALLERVQQELSEILELRVLLVDEQGQLLHVFGDTRDLLRIPAGRPALNVFQLLPRSASSAVRAALARAVREQRPVVFGNVVVAPDHPPLTVHIRRIGDIGGSAPVYAVLLVESELALSSTDDREAWDAPAEQRSRIVTLERELAASRENLQATIEELETSNEELQATNEELLASNEELQSANEELQSVNEELQTVNAEYQEKISELIGLNNDIEHLMRSTGVGSIFVDRDLRIRKFTDAATALLAVLPQDVGRPLGHLAVASKGLDLVGIAQRVIRGGETEVHDVALPDGVHLQLRVLPYRSERGTEGAVLSVVDVTDLMRARERIQAILDALPSSVAVLDSRGVILQTNATWARFARENEGSSALATGAGLDYLEATRKATDDPASLRIVEGIEAVLSGRRDAFQLRYPCHAPRQRRYFLLQVMALTYGSVRGAVVLHVDVTEATLDLERAQSWIDEVQRLDLAAAGHTLPPPPDLRA